MPAESLIYPGRDPFDDPWRRLYWTLPASALIWALMLWGLVSFMQTPPPRPAEQAPIEAQFIEIPPPPRPPARVVEPERPPPPKPVIKEIKPVPLPITEPQKPTEKEEQAAPRETPPAPAAIPSPVLQSAPAAAETPANPANELPAAPKAAPVPAAPPAPAQSEPRAMPAESGQGAGARNTINATSAARAIVRPMPRIPGDLRENALNASALARFHIAEDGSVSVELVRPTQIPRLNILLMDTLKNWKFMPAIKDGKPVAATEDIEIKIKVN